MTYITRAIESTFKRLSSEFPAILLIGPRQVGKTTMLQHLMEEESVTREYVTLDDLTERELAINDPKMFFQIHTPPIFIDEVQYAPELLPYIKIHIDESFKPGDFWLTGSQIFRLMDGVRESLAGRICLLNISFMSQAEINNLPSVPFEIDIDKLMKRSKNIKPVDAPSLYNNIFKGGLPALISGQYKDAKAVYSSYIGTYIERDVKELSGTIETLKFLNFITATAALTGQLVNYKTIADISSIDQVTVKNWLMILEKLGVIFYLHPFSNNTLKRTISKPKLYFYDTGLVAYLTRWSNGETLMNGAMSGAILENYVAAEIMKSYLNSGLEPYIYYYRDKDAKEIDIILERDGKLFPIEIKRTASPSLGLTKVFGVIDKSTLERSHGAVICLGDRLSAFDSNNFIIPVWMI